MLSVAPGAILSVERGPDWLFAKIGAADAAPEAICARDASSLADSLWSLLERHFTYRMVIECDGSLQFDSELIGQLIALQRRVADHGGVLRICGLPEPAQQSLRFMRLEERIPHFCNRTEAVLCRRPPQPR